MMQIRRVYAKVHGRVQGVFFREYTRRQGEALGLNGWVRNLADGTVEAVVEGEADRVATMVAWLHTGSPQSSVASVDTKEEEPRGEKGFTIRH